MAKSVDIDVNMKGSGTKKVTVDAKKAGDQLDKTANSAQTADRRIKGVANASSGASKNFSKMSQGMTGGIVPAYAVLAANIFAIGAAFRFLKSQADLANLEASQIQFAQNTGVALGHMTEKLREASGGMLGFKEAGQATAIGLAQGFSGSQMAKLTEGARKVSIALGRDFEDSFDRLVRGASKAEPELLDELGIVLRLETATKNYAAAIGKQVTALTAAERSQAVLIETQKQLDEKYGEVEADDNPFTVLSKTFDDLVMNITQTVLPAFEAMANFIAKNAKVALVFFGLLALSIIKSMLPIDSWKEKIKVWGDTHAQELQDAKDDVDKYKASILSAQQVLERKKSGASIQVQKGAVAAKAAGGKSKALDAAAAGNMTKAQQRQLKQQLDTAKKQWKKHGRVIRGTFKGVHGDLINKIAKDLKVVTSKTSRWKTGINTIRNSVKRVRVIYKSLKVVATRTFNAMARGARKVGKAMGMMMKGAVIFAVLQQIYNMFVKITEAPHTVVTAVISMIGNVVKPFEWLFNTIMGALTDFMNSIQGVMNKLIDKIPKWMLPGGLESFRFDVDDGWEDIDLSGKVEDLATGVVEVFVSLDELKAKEEEIQANNLWDERLVSVREYAVGVRDSLNMILDGMDKRTNEIVELSGMGTMSGAEGGPLSSEEQAQIQSILQRRGLQLMNGIASLDIGADMEEKLKGLDTPEQKDAVLTALMEEIGTDRFANVAPALVEAIRTGDVETVKGITTASGIYVANTKDLADSINNIPTQIGKDLFKNEEYMDSLMNLRNSLEEHAETAEITTTAHQDLENAFSMFGGANAYLALLKELRAEVQAIKDDEAKIALDTMAGQFLPPGLKAEYTELLNIRKAELVVRKQLSDIATLEQQILAARGPEGQTPTKELDAQLLALKALLEQQRFAVIQAEKAATSTQKIMNNLGQSIETNLISNINAVIDGTKSIKEGFADMAIAVLQSLSQIIVKLMVMKALQATGLPIFTAAGSGAKGGVFNPPEEYARGGIAKSLNRRDGSGGYPAILHGTEAVVPLPDGRSIPVNMTGGANNIVVNVSGSGEGGMSTQGGDNEGLGRAIAAAVQAELQNQKRSGGILNPYGAA